MSKKTKTIKKAYKGVLNGYCDIPWCRPYKDLINAAELLEKLEKAEDLDSIFDVADEVVSRCSKAQVNPETPETEKIRAHCLQRAIGGLNHVF